MDHRYTVVLLEILIFWLRVHCTWGTNFVEIVVFPERFHLGLLRICRRCHPIPIPAIINLSIGSTVVNVCRLKIKKLDHLEIECSQFGVQKLRVHQISMGDHHQRRFHIAKKISQKHLNSENKYEALQTFFYAKTFEKMDQYIS